MDNFPKYSSIENLYRSNEVLQYPIVATEKLHGTNCRIMWTESHGLVLGGKKQILYADGNKVGNALGEIFDGYNFTQWCLENVDIEKLKKYPDHVFYGEFHGSNIQKGVKYLDEKDFRVFDVREPEGEYLDWGDVMFASSNVGLKLVHTVFSGLATLDDLNRLVDITSLTGQLNGVTVENNIAEGIVIKPLKERRDRRGNRIIAKFKSAKFAENTKAPKVRKPDPELAALQDAAREFASACVTPGRVATIAEHITRDGNTELKISRTGEFLRAFINDVREEHSDVYDVLDKKQQNQYNKIVNAQASLLWRDYLQEL